MKRILPEGYYTQDEANRYLVRIQQGPYSGLFIQICEDIKIIEDYLKSDPHLTGAPQLCYNYRILHYATCDPHECESSKSLSRIIAAISVELLSQEIESGGCIESVPCRNPGIKNPI
jgi:hypothetical protein